MTKNIMFSTTRQWNCGDEFILFGVLNIIDELIGHKAYNPLIYNRNPSIRPVFENINFKHPIECLKKYAFSQLNECDNSYHGRMEWGGVIDAAFCAGTPEWFGPRNYDFYSEVKKNKLPLYILGAGSFPGKYFKNVKERSIIENARVLTFRTKALADSAKAMGLNKAKYIPCPAILSATKEQEKEWICDSSERVIGLGYNICSDHIVPDIGLSEKAYKFSEFLFEEIIKSFIGKRVKFVAICHYIDELPFAREFFKKYNIPVRYSFNSQDYFSIYKEIDCLISSRVHGCGICASLGIPSIGIAHDNRGDTINGFLSDLITPQSNITEILSSLDEMISNLDSRHEAILLHKSRVLNSYLDIFDGIDLFKR